MARQIRLFVEHALGAEQPVPLTREQAHYLFGVMRLGKGATVHLFNGLDGEWAATVVETGKKGGTLLCQAQSVPQGAPPDLWLLFAPIKKARTDFIVEKAVEMGAARILPVGTDFTNAERIRQDRLQAHAVEAAEQCEITYVPEVAPLERLDRVLDRWPEGRRLMFCDETLATDGLREAATREEPADATAPWAILVGPEGGFSDAERRRLLSFPLARPTRLGPRILRADTAAVAALTVWQSRYGDWR